MNHLLALTLMFFCPASRNILQNVNTDLFHTMIVCAHDENIIELIHMTPT